MRRLYRYLFLAVFLAIIGVLSIGWSVFRAKRANLGPAAIAYRVSRANVARTVRAVGRTKPLMTVTVRSVVPGQVSALHVREGQAVAAGQPLLDVMPDHSFALMLQRAYYSVEGGEASLRLAQGDYERKRKLLHEGLVSSSDYENADARLAQAKVALELAKSESRILADAIGSKHTWVPGGRSTALRIIAPAAGTVVSIKVAVGDTITSGTNALGEGGGTALLRIADLGHLLVRGEISEQDIRWVQRGQSVSVTLLGAGTTLAGSVDTIAREAASPQGPVSYYTNVVLSNPEVLVADLNCDLEIKVAERKDVLAIPRVAVQQKGGASFVRLRPEKGIPSDARVTCGLVGDDLVEITDGLLEGQTIELGSAVASPGTAVTSAK